MSGQVYRQEHSGDSEEEKPRRGVISDGSAPLRVTDRLDPDCHSFPHSEVYPRAWVTRGTTGSLPSTCSRSKGDTDKSSGRDHSKERARMWFGVPGREGEACTTPHLERFHRSQATSSWGHNTAGSSSAWRQGSFFLLCSVLCSSERLSNLLQATPLKPSPWSFQAPSAAGPTSLRNCCSLPSLQ